MSSGLLLRDIGEKRLIAEYIKPLFNPSGDPHGVGDDCAVILLNKGTCITTSTDRVPTDLISFRLGIIDYRGLGYYLAVLNISDIAASGARPAGLLLNLAFPSNFALQDFLSLLSGVNAAAIRYSAPVLGGDLSTAAEMNLVATSLGIAQEGHTLFRSGAKPGNLVFCSDVIGISATAFAHFLSDREDKLSLSTDEYNLLCSKFTEPTPRVELGLALAASNACTAAMDVTDGIGQSLFEIADASRVRIRIDAERLPLSLISEKVSEYYGLDVTEMVLSAAADFQLVGTVNAAADGFSQISPFLHIIGEVEAGSGLMLQRQGNAAIPFTPKGWNYFI